MTDKPMKIHSDQAWGIASQWSFCLASDTRTLAAQIDVALKAAYERGRIDGSNNTFNNLSDTALCCSVAGNADAYERGRREAMEECAEICRLVTGDFEDSSDDQNDFDFTLMSQGSDECTSQIRKRMKEQGDG